MNVLRVFTNRSSVSDVLEWFVWDGSNLHSNSDRVELSQEGDRILVHTDKCFEFNRSGTADKIKPTPLISAVVGVATTLDFITALTSLTCEPIAYRYSPGCPTAFKTPTNTDNWLLAAPAVVSRQPLVALGLDKITHPGRITGGRHEFTITNRLLDPTKLRDNGVDEVDVDFVEAVVSGLRSKVVGAGPYYVNAYLNGELVSVVEFHDKLQRMLSASEESDYNYIEMLRRGYIKCYNIIFMDYVD